MVSAQSKFRFHREEGKLTGVNWVTPPFRPTMISPNEPTAIDRSALVRLASCIQSILMLSQNEDHTPSTSISMVRPNETPEQSPALALLP